MFRLKRYETYEVYFSQENNILENLGTHVQTCDGYSRTMDCIDTIEKVAEYVAGGLFIHIVTSKGSVISIDDIDRGSIYSVG